MVIVYEKECEAASKNIKAITALARRLSAISKELKKQGVYVFGGSGSGTIRFNDGWDKPLILAHIGQGFDGGCGASRDDGPDGLLRGE